MRKRPTEKGRNHRPEKEFVARLNGISPLHTYISECLSVERMNTNWSLNPELPLTFNVPHKSNDYFISHFPGRRQLRPHEPCRRQRLDQHHHPRRLQRGEQAPGRVPPRKVLRAERDWTQQDRATRLDVARQTIIAIEKGKFDPGLSLTFKISRLFEMPIEEIFDPDH